MTPTKEQIDRLISDYGKATTLADWMRYAYALRTALQWLQKSKDR